MPFREKVVWITGASSGIGEHLAYAFAAKGAKLILSSRNQAELERVQQNCPLGTPVTILPMDVTQYDELPALAQKAFGYYGQLDILVNNAGLTQRALVKDAPFKMDEHIMAVNYLGTVALTKAVLPFMLEQQAGKIVVVSSIMGKIGTPLRSAYAASKHALHGFFDCLRAEVHDAGIQVCLLVPGYVNTNISRNALRGQGERYQGLPDSTQQGLHPTDFARRALRAIAAGKNEALIGGKETLAVYLKRFFPGLLARMVRKVKVT